MFVQKVMMMKELINVLHEERNTLVLRNKGNIWSYDGHGINDLMKILKNSPRLLDGAAVADKVVGKAAAALLILGEVKAVYAETISEQALQLFAEAKKKALSLDYAPIEVSYDKKVEYISNRVGDGWCPLELACKDAVTPKECLQKIQAKLQEMAH